MLIVPRRMASSWTPAQISTALWLDASDSSTITTVSGAVSQWNDKSGNNRHISQVTASSRPSYANTFNGRSVVTFDGVNDILDNASPGLNGLSTATIIAVMRYVTAGSTEDVAMGIGITNPSDGRDRLLYRASNGTTQGFAGWSIDVLSSIHAIDTGNFHTFAGWNTGLAPSNQVTIAKDGTTATYTPSGSGTSLNTTVDGFSVGSLRGSLVGNYYTNMEVGEIVVLASAVSQANFDLITGYMHHRWGIANLLPAGHPYKTAAP